jgi:hypothetical protein
MGRRVLQTPTPDRIPKARTGSFRPRCGRTQRGTGRGMNPERQGTTRSDGRARHRSDATARRDSDEVTGAIHIRLGGEFLMNPGRSAMPVAPRPTTSSSCVGVRPADGRAAEQEHLVFGDPPWL